MRRPAVAEVLRAWLCESTGQVTHQQALQTLKDVLSYIKGCVFIEDVLDKLTLQPVVAVMQHFLQAEQPFPWPLQEVNSNRDLGAPLDKQALPGSTACTTQPLLGGWCAD